MTIETTINGGLPVRASGEVVKCLGTEWPGHDYIDYLEIRFRSGHEYRRELSEDDECRIVREIMEQWRGE